MSEISVEMNQAPQSIIYLVDDDKSILDSLTFILNKAGAECVAFQDPQEFLNVLPADGTGCVIADLSMPSLSGIDLLRELSARKVSIPVVLLSGCGTISTAVEALHLGAVDFLEKPISTTKLLEVVHRALEIDAKRLVESQSVEHLEQRIRTLTPRQQEVMECILRGLLSKQIATKLKISIKTVEVHRSQIARKLGADSLASLVQMLTTYSLRKDHRFDRELY